jgi:hypothetical protein
MNMYEDEHEVKVLHYLVVLSLLSQLKRHQQNLRRRTPSSSPYPVPQPASHPLQSLDRLPLLIQWSIAVTPLLPTGRREKVRRGIELEVKKAEIKKREEREMKEGKNGGEKQRWLSKKKIIEEKKGR